MFAPLPPRSPPVHDGGILGLQLGTPGNFWDVLPGADHPPSSAPIEALVNTVYRDPLGLLAEAASFKDGPDEEDAGQEEPGVGIASLGCFANVPSPATPFASFLGTAKIMKLITLNE